MEAYRIILGSDITFQHGQNKTFQEQRAEERDQARAIAKRELKKLGRCKQGFDGPDVVSGDPLGRYGYFFVTCRERQVN